MDHGTPMVKEMKLFESKGPVTEQYKQSASHLLLFSSLYLTVHDCWNPYN